MTANLELVSTDDLVSEILKRHDHGAFVGMRTLSGEEGQIGQLQIVRRWKGNSHCCAGLCDDIKQDILGDCKARQVTEEDESPADDGET